MRARRTSRTGGADVADGAGRTGGAVGAGGPGGVVAACRRAAGLTVASLVPSAATGALATACGVGLLATSGWLITRSATRPPVFVVSVAVGAVQAFALGRGLVRYLQRLQVHDLALRVLGRLRLRLFDDLEPRVPGGLPDGGRGAVLQAVVADADTVANGLAQGVTAAVDVVAAIAFGVLVAVAVSPLLAGVLAAGSLLAVATALAGARTGRRQELAEAARRTELAATVVDTLASARELVALGREDLVAARLADVAQRSVAGARRQGVLSGLARGATTWVAGAGLLAVVAVGSAAPPAERPSGVLLAMVVFASLATFDQVVALPGVLADTGPAGAAARRLGALGELPLPTRDDPPVAPGVVDGDPAPVSGEAAGAELAGLWALGTDGRPVLRDVGLRVGAGRRVALTGPSGAGKSSVLHTLVHFLEPARGTARVADRDVRSLRRTELAALVGWLGEEPHVFAATVADNLRLARPDADDAACVDVLQRVGLGPWLQGLPDGLATRLGTGGRGVSAGERQRLGLARALLAGGGVLLLDEPTAHVDPLTAGPLLDDLLGAAGPERSVLLVSHDDDVGARVDAVVTMDAGRVTGRRPGHRPRAPTGR